MRNRARSYAHANPRQFRGKTTFMSETATKTAEPVTIKKYANRRLYNTGTSAYVTLEDLAAMVKTGEDFVVYGASMQMLVPRYLEVSIESLTREQEKFRQQMAQAFGVGAFTSLEEQVRRNMDMFERAFAMFVPFARRDSAGSEAGSEADKASGKAGDIDDLKRQLDEMKRKVDRLTGGGQ